MTEQFPDVPKEIVDLLNSPLPVEAVHPHPTKSYLSTIKAPYVVERLNQAFGLNGWRDNYEVVSDTGKMVVIKGFLSVAKYGIERQAFGGNDNDDRGDAYKGACTDALTKMASFLGIGADVYKGIRDKSNAQSKPAPAPIPEDAAAKGLWPTTVEHDTLRCYVLSVTERPGKYEGTAQLEVSHMGRDGKTQVSTKTQFLKTSDDFFSMVKNSAQHNCSFKLEKKGQYLNIVGLLECELPKAKE